MDDKEKYKLEQEAGQWRRGKAVARTDLTRSVQFALVRPTVTVDAPSSVKIAEAKKQAEALADQHFIADTDDVISAMGEIKALSKEIEPPNDGGLINSYFTFYYVQKMGGLKVNKYREMLNP